MQFLTLVMVHVQLGLRTSPAQPSLLNHAFLRELHGLLCPPVMFMSEASQRPPTCASASLAARA